MSLSQTLKHRVSIQARTEGQDEIGQPFETWVEHAAVWADIRVSGGLEAIRSGAVTSKVKASIRIRYREDIDSGMRVVYGSTIYIIIGVLPDHVKREHLDLVSEILE